MDTNQFLELIYTRQDKIAEDVTDIKVAVAQQHEQLTAHITSSAGVALMVRGLGARVNKLEIMRSRTKIIALFIVKVVGISSALTGAAYGAIRLFQTI